MAERASRIFYSAALATPGLFDAGERRRLTQARDAKREHVIRLNAALGADAVGPDDYEVDLPEAVVRDPRKALALGAAWRSCSSASTSRRRLRGRPGSRELIGRLLSVDDQVLSTLRAMGGKASTEGSLAR